MPITAGSTPTVAHDAIRASGSSPRRRASSAAVISTVTAAPSLSPDALPAVTVPSLLNAGRSLASVSAVVPALMYSSCVDHHVALAGLDRHRHDLVLEPARRLRRRRLVLRARPRTRPAARG